MAEALWNRPPKKFWQSIRKSKKSRLPSTVGGETGNKAVTVMRRKHFSALLNSSKNCEIDNFVHQNINSHGSFEEIEELMCNSFKVKALLHKQPLNRAAGKNGIFAEHIFYADLSVCNYLSSLFNVCLMHGKIPQECMQTVIVPICKNKNGNIVAAELRFCPLLHIDMLKTRNNTLPGLFDLSTVCVHDNSCMSRKIEVRSC